LDRELFRINEKFNIIREKMQYEKSNFKAILKTDQGVEFFGKDESEEEDETKVNDPLLQKQEEKKNQILEQQWIP